MARIDRSIRHGQTLEAALRNFHAAIEDAQTRYSSWIERVDWSTDRRSAVLSGSGFSIELTCDDEYLHARGTVSMMFKLMEGRIMQQIEAVLRQQAAAEGMPPRASV